MERLEREKFQYEDKYKSAAQRLLNKQKEYEELIRLKEEEERLLQEKIDSLRTENKQIKDIMMK